MICGRVLTSSGSNWKACAIVLCLSDTRQGNAKAEAEEGRKTTSDDRRSREGKVVGKYIWTEDEELVNVRAESETVDSSKISSGSLVSGLCNKVWKCGQQRK